MRLFNKNFVTFCFDVDLYADFDFFKSFIKKKYIRLSIVVVARYNINKLMLIKRIMLIEIRLIKKIYVRVLAFFKIITS